MKKIYFLLLVGLIPVLASAQTPTDGLMMAKGNLCTGFMYTNDQWKEYWEGTLKRDNGNIGKVTTQSLMWYGTYGITSKVNVIAVLPYVKTNASKGTLHSMEGIQDLMLSVKYNFFRKDFGDNSFRTFVVGSFSTPLSDYTPDFLPLSIGLASTTASGRLTANYTFLKNWFVNGSVGYTFRSNVELDRPSYYTEDQLFLTNEVDMPNVFDYFISAGYRTGSLQAELNLIQQNTLGGDDIRRQDMPFVSNKMNYLKGGVLVMYYLPKPKGLAVRGSALYTLSGRNAGQATTLMGGLLYTINFMKNQ